MQRSTISSALILRGSIRFSLRCAAISSSTARSGMASRLPASYRYQPDPVFWPNRPSSQMRSASGNFGDDGSSA